ncbi:MAG TPA: RNA 2',3'-cyclic phosphodiesterase [Planococcus sp. (in: firmicutes)]|nr:RNA 2',3'-cyclic phosphodiesterase [Planococcus sp. (in: firmicutes)]
MDKHYFVGIPVPLDVAKHLAETRKGWNLQSHKIYSSPEDMHITLLFIGPASEEQISRLIDELSQLKHPQFTLTVKGVETFGNPTTPRVVYAAIEAEPQLFELHQEIIEASKLKDLVGDIKSLVPHITLAKKWGGGEPFRTELGIRPVSFKVSAFSVFEIQPQQQPKYKPISTIKLEGET